MKLCEPSFALHTYHMCASGARLGSVEEKGSHCFSEFGSGAPAPIPRHTLSATLAWVEPGLLAEASLFLLSSSTTFCTTITRFSARTSFTRATSVLPFLCFWLTTGTLLPEASLGRPLVVVSPNSIDHGEDETIQDYLRILLSNAAKDDFDEEYMATDGHPSGRVPTRCSTWLGARIGRLPSEDPL